MQFETATYQVVERGCQFTAPHISLGPGFDTGSMRQNMG